MLASLSFWQYVSIALSAWIFYDSFKQKRYLSGLLWAITSFYLPFLGIIYWTIGRNTHIHTFRNSNTNRPSQASTHKKLCPKCGTENSTAYCTQCGNKLQL